MKNGPYTLVVAPAGYTGKRYRGRYAYEHHVVWWRETGWVPGPGFSVHHRNGIKTDNRIENLAVLTAKDHAVEHAFTPMQKMVCGWCEKVFELPVRVVKMRLKQNKNYLLFCSRSCGAKYQFRGSSIGG